MMTVTAVASTSQKIENAKEGPKIVVVYKCTFTGAFDPVYIYQNAATIGVPDYGAYVVGTTSEMYCSGTDAAITPNSPYTGTTAHPSEFRYTATFSTISAERFDLSPLSRPAVISGGGIELTETRRVDINAKPITNSVGDYFEGLPNFYIPGSEISVSWNVSSNPMSTCQAYSFSTNQSSIWGQSANTGLIGRMSCQNQFEVYQGYLIEYWRLTVPIRFRSNGNWMFQPLDYGYRYLDSGTVTTYVDPESNATGPVFLDGTGKLLNGDGTANPDAPVIYPASSGSTPAGYQVYPSKDWSGIGGPVSPFS